MARYQIPDDRHLRDRYREEVEQGFEYQCILGLTSSRRISTGDSYEQSCSDPDALFTQCFYPLYIKGDRALPDRLKAHVQQMIEEGTPESLRQAVGLACAQREIEQRYEPDSLPFHIEFDLKAIASALQTHQEALHRVTFPESTQDAYHMLTHYFELTFGKAESQGGGESKTPNARSTAQPKADEPKKDPPKKDPPKTGNELLSWFEKAINFVKKMAESLDASDSNPRGGRTSQSEKTSQAQQRLSAMIEWLKAQQAASAENRGNVSESDRAAREARIQELTEQMRARLQARAQKAREAQKAQEAQASEQSRSESSSPEKLEHAYKTAIQSSAASERELYMEEDAGFQALFDYFNQSAGDQSDQAGSPCILYPASEGAQEDNLPKTQPEQSPTEAPAPPVAESPAPPAAPSATSSGASSESEERPMADRIRAIFQGGSQAVPQASQQPQTSQQPPQATHKSPQAPLPQDNPQLRQYEAALKEGREFEAILGARLQDRISMSNSKVPSLSDAFILYSRCFYPRFLAGDTELPSRLSRHFMRLLLQGDPMQIYQAAELVAVQAFNFKQGSPTPPFKVEYPIPRLLHAISFYEEKLREEYHPDLKMTYYQAIKLSLKAHARIDL